MPIRSNRTKAEKEKSRKPAKEKPTPLKMDKVVACKGVRMSRPGQEEIEFELDSKKKSNIPLKEVLKQENDVMKKIYLKLNEDYHPSLEAAHEIINQISKNRRELGHEQSEKGVKIWNPEGKRVLMEPFYLMFYHDATEDVRYFSVEESLGKASNGLLEILINQLSTHDEDELKLRIKLEHQLRMNKENSRELKKKRRI